MQQCLQLVLIGLTGLRIAAGHAHEGSKQTDTLNSPRVPSPHVLLLVWRPADARLPNPRPRLSIDRRVDHLVVDLHPPVAGAPSCSVLSALPARCRASRNVTGRVSPHAGRRFAPGSPRKRHQTPHADGLKHFTCRRSGRDPTLRTPRPDRRGSPRGGAEPPSRRLRRAGPRCPAPRRRPVWAAYTSPWDERPRSRKWEIGRSWAPLFNTSSHGSGLARPICNMS